MRIYFSDKFLVHEISVYDNNPQKFLVLLPSSKPYLWMKDTAEVHTQSLSLSLSLFLFLFLFESCISAYVKEAFSYGRWFFQTFPGCEIQKGFNIFLKRNNKHWHIPDHYKKQKKNQKKPLSCSEGNASYLFPWKIQQIQIVQ